MPYKVEVDIPERGEQDVYVHGLGTFANGSVNEVDDDQMARFAAANAVQKMSSFDSEGKFSIHNSSPDPTKVNIYGVTITKVNDGDDTPKDNEPTGEEAK
jgi:hypothetical protein